jgi:hypothetical protein
MHSYLLSYSLFDQKHQRSSILALGTFVTLTSLCSSGLAQTTSTFIPEDVEPPFLPQGDWLDASSWDTANFPGNGQPTAGATYNAVANTGSLRMDGDVTIESFVLTGDGRLGASRDGRKVLTLNGPFNWDGGSISGEVTINALAGVNFVGDDTKVINTSFTVGGGLVFQPIINIPSGKMDQSAAALRVLPYFS